MNVSKVVVRTTLKTVQKLKQFKTVSTFTLENEKKFCFKNIMFPLTFMNLHKKIQQKGLQTISKYVCFTKHSYMQKYIEISYICIEKLIIKIKMNEWMNECLHVSVFVQLSNYLLKKCFFLQYVIGFHHRP